MNTKSPESLKGNSSKLTKHSFGIKDQQIKFCLPVIKHQDHTNLLNKFFGMTQFILKWSKYTMQQHATATFEKADGLSVKSRQYGGHVELKWVKTAFQKNPEINGGGVCSAVNKISSFEQQIHWHGMVGITIFIFHPITSPFINIFLPEPSLLETLVWWGSYLLWVRELTCDHEFFLYWWFPKNLRGRLRRVGGGSSETSLSDWLCVMDPRRNPKAPLYSTTYQGGLWMSCYLLCKKS